MFMSEKLMFLLRYYRFQITEVTFVMQYPFRNIYLYAQVSEASERSESSCIFISQERTYVTSNIRFIIYTLFFDQYRITCKMLRTNLTLLALSNELFWHKFTLFNLDTFQHSSLTVIITLLWKSCFYYDFNNCFYRCQNNNRKWHLPYIILS